MGKADTAFSRTAKVDDTTIGWRFKNKTMHALHGTDSMPETAENVSVEFKISREDQDAFALLSQQRAGKAMAAGRFDREIVPVQIRTKIGIKTVSLDEHPRPDTALEQLARLKGVVHAEGTVTAGNASGVNDGAAALIHASRAIAEHNGQTGRAWCRERVC